MDGWMDRWIDGYIYIYIYTHICICTYMYRERDIDTVLSLLPLSSLLLL